MTTATIETKAPIRHKLGRVTAKIWENVTQEGEIYHTIDFLRVYKDESGDFKESRTFTQGDLACIVAMAPQLNAALSELISS